MNRHSSIPALAVSFALLGAVAWMAASQGAGGPLFTRVASQADARSGGQPVAPTPTRLGDAR